VPPTSQLDGTVMRADSIRKDSRESSAVEGAWTASEAGMPALGRPCVLHRWPLPHEAVAEPHARRTNATLARESPPAQDLPRLANPFLVHSPAPLVKLMGQPRVLAEGKWRVARTMPDVVPAVYL
jgi:hypothetical protein